MRGLRVRWNMTRGYARLHAGRFVLQLEHTPQFEGDPKAWSWLVSVDGKSTPGQCGNSRSENAARQACVKVVKKVLAAEARALDQLGDEGLGS